MNQELVAIQIDALPKEAGLLPVTEWEDGTPRVKDVELGAWLGYKTERNVRTLLKKHLETLQEFGEVALQVAAQVRANGATHEVTEYYLNRDQAVYLTSQAGTPKARALTVYVVKVFGAYLDGKLAARTEEVERELNLTRSRVQYLEADQE